MKRTFFDAKGFHWTVKSLEDGWTCARCGGRSVDLPVRSQDLHWLTDADLRLIEEENSPKARVERFATQGTPAALVAILEHPEHRSFIDEYGESGFTPLFAAAQETGDADRVRRVEALLAAGANPDKEQDKVGYLNETPLRLAVTNNDRAVFEAILGSDQMTKARLLELHSESVSRSETNDKYLREIRNMIDLIEQSLRSRNIDLPPGRGPTLP